MFQMVPFLLFCQDLRLNEDGIYECDSVINFQEVNLIEKVKSKVLSLNYKISSSSDSEIHAQRASPLGIFSMIYSLSIVVKENRYKIRFSNFLLQYEKGLSPIEKKLWKKTALKKHQ